MAPTHYTWKGLSPAGFHSLHYVEWGDPSNPQVLVCVHGLSRNCRDFDYLAQALQKDYRIICPDLPGRGQSAWLKDPNYYAYPQYLSDLTALLARLNVESVDWLGTSMGGILGMFMAVQPETPVKRLIINDIGAFIPAEPLKRIAQYVSSSPICSSFDQAKLYLKQILSPFGITKEEHWDHLARYSIVEVSPHQYGLRHDPKITTHFANEDVNLWHYWQAITCPVLVLRGKESDILPVNIAYKMGEKPQTTLIEFENIGHAPALMVAEQIEPIQRWLNHSFSN